MSHDRGLEVRAEYEQLVHGSELPCLRQRSAHVLCAEPKRAASSGLRAGVCVVTMHAGTGGHRSLKGAQRVQLHGGGARRGHLPVNAPCWQRKEPLYKVNSTFFQVHASLNLCLKCGRNMNYFLNARDKFVGQLVTLIRSGIARLTAAKPLRSRVSSVETALITVYHSPYRQGGVRES